MLNRLSSKILPQGPKVHLTTTIKARSQHSFTIVPVKERVTSQLVERMVSEIQDV